MVAVESPLAVIDLGSNSARIAVLRLDGAGQLDIIADARTSLQLARHIDARGGSRRAPSPRRSLRCEISAPWRRRRRGAHRRGCDCRHPHGDQSRQRARPSRSRHGACNPGHRRRRGGALRVSRCGPRAADRHRLPHRRRRRQLRARLLRTPPRAALVDLRARRRWWPPTSSCKRPAPASEVTALRDHVARTLRDAGVPVLPEDGGMVGTGGTVRNLAKIHMRSVGHPIARVDGYVLQRRDVRDLTSRLASRNLSSLRTVPGLSTDRADSITGGALVVDRRDGGARSADPHGVRPRPARGHRTRELDPAPARGLAVRRARSRRSRRGSRPGTSSALSAASSSSGRSSASPTPP